MKKSLMNKIIIVFVTTIIVGSISVYASYDYYSEKISFIPNNKSWEVNNISNALDDIYTKQTDVINQKESEISEQKTNINSMNSNIKTIQSTITSKNSTISTQEETIKNLTNTNTRLSNQLNGLKNANCTSGSYKIDSSCTTTTGCKILDFEPSIIILNVISSTSVDTLWYYNKDMSKMLYLGKDTSFTDWTRNTTLTFSDRFMSSGNTLALRNVWAKWVGQTGYYIACK